MTEKQNQQEEQEPQPITMGSEDEDATWADYMVGGGTVGSVDTKEEAIQRISSWANRGTFRQFYTEMQSKMGHDEEHEVAMEDDAMVFYAVRKEGGFLGIGGKTVREPVLKLEQQGEEVVIAEDPRNDEFLVQLASELQPH